MLAALGSPKRRASSTKTPNASPTAA